MRELKLRLTDENYEKIKTIKENSNASLNLILNMIVDSYDSKNKVNCKLEFKKTSTKKNTMLHIRITEDEYIYLKEQAKIHGFKSASKEVKFRLVSTMYNENFFSPIEMKELLGAANQMKRLGANISTLIKAIYSKNRNVIFNFENLEKTIELAKNYIKNCSGIIGKYCDILDKRI